MSGDNVPQTVDAGRAPAMPTAARYWPELVGFEAAGADDRGRPTRGVYGLPAVTGYTKLPPLGDCEAMATEIAAALAPAGVEAGVALARRVLGRYTAREFIDAEVFVAELSRVFAEAPADIGAAVADKLRSRKFPPNTGDTLEFLTPLIDERRRALARVRELVAEHERRRGHAPGQLSETIRRFKSLAPAIQAVLGADAFGRIWPTLWIVSDDGARMMVAQPTAMLRDWTLRHLPVIAEAAGRQVELMVKSKPAAGSRKAGAGAPRPIGDVLDGGGR